VGDVIYVALLVAFFTISALFVKACEWIVGTTELAPGAGDVGDKDDRLPEEHLIPEEDGDEKVPA
jgi:hypothetical protein